MHIVMTFGSSCAVLCCAVLCTACGWLYVLYMRIHHIVQMFSNYKGHEIVILLYLQLPCVSFGVALLDNVCAQ